MGAIWAPKSLKFKVFFGLFFGIDFMLIYVDFELILEPILMTSGFQNATREGKRDFMKNLCFLKEIDVFEGPRLHLGGQNR